MTFAPYEDNAPLWDATAQVILASYLEPFSTKSTVAREQANAVALAASLGLLTTVLPDGRTYGNFWRVTPKGAAAVFGINQ